MHYFDALPFSLYGNNILRKINIYYYNIMSEIFNMNQENSKRKKKLESKRKYYYKNKIKLNQYSTMYRKNNIERYNEYMRNYVINNRESINLNVNKYYNKLKLKTAFCCKCNKEIKCSNIYYHNKTKKHKSKELAIIEQPN